MRAAGPPRLARWLLERFGTASRLHSLVGDLAEEYANGRSGAWYWHQALGTVALDFVRSLRTHSLSSIVAVITGAKRRDRIRADAFVWLARLRRGLRADEGAELRDWLKRRSHRACIARTAAERDGPEALAVLGEIFLVNPAWIDSSPRRNPVINVAAALTATFIAALPLAYTHHYMPGFLLSPALEGSYTETMGTAFASGRHTLRRVVLADGTRVLMNRGTRMLVLGRSVALTRGEATFAVAGHGPPSFELTVGERRFDTLSAAFNVRMTGKDAMEITVLTGIVTVFPPHPSASINPAALRDGDIELPVPTLLNPRQTLDVEPSRESLRTLSELEVQARIAWQRG